MSAPVALQIFVGLLLFAAVFIPLERVLPAHPMPALRRGWSTDVLYYITGCFIGRLSDSISFTGVILLRPLIPRLFHFDAAGQPAWLQFLELVIVADFSAYWFHRVLHRNRFLWKFHRVHHSSEHMDWLANVRLHPIDKFAGDCFQFIPLMCIGFSSAALLTYTIFLGFQGFLNHANVRLNYGPLRWVVASPQFHHWHHCRDPSAYDRNFAPHLVVFDLLFGTAKIPAARVMPDRYGVYDEVPADFWGQMLHPFAKASAVSEAKSSIAGTAETKIALGGGSFSGWPQPRFDPPVDQRPLVTR
jgi:sterol desaturase/sphingolipid hydroxylase (fatty acid hydroxylase superfamily)